MVNGVHFGIVRIEECFILKWGLFHNYHINWIPKTGSWFYFVVNQGFDTNDGITLERTTIMGKLIWRFAL